MLVADPSSCCDVCFGTFGPDTECHCIPCGHVFCRPCLSNLSSLVCPMCRTHLNSRSRIRKIIVDWTQASGSDGGTRHQPVAVRVQRELEEQLAQEADRGITLRRAFELHQKVQDFMKQRPENEHIVLKTFASVICNLYETKDQLADLKELKQQLERRNTRLEHQRRTWEKQKALLEDEKRKMLTCIHHSESVSESMITFLLGEVHTQKEVIKQLSKSLPPVGSLPTTQSSFPPASPSHPPPSSPSPPPLNVLSPFAPRRDSTQDILRQIEHRHYAQPDVFHLPSPGRRYIQQHRLRDPSIPAAPLAPQPTLATPPLTPLTNDQMGLASPVPVLEPATSHTSELLPPPPLPTVHVPEPWLDVWPYVPIPQPQNRRNNAAEEHATWTKAAQHQRIPQGVVYQGQMQPRAKANVWLPRGFSPAFYEA